MSDVPPPSPSEFDRIWEGAGPRSSPPVAGVEGVPLVIPSPMAVTTRRPSVLTTAAVVLLVLAVLHGLAGALGLTVLRSSTSSQGLQTSAVHLTLVVAIALLVVAGLELITALLVFRMSGIGRILGLVLASLELLSGLKVLIDGGGTAVLAIGIDLFLIYALSTTGYVFARAQRG